MRGFDVNGGVEIGAPALTRRRFVGGIGALGIGCAGGAALPVGKAVASGGAGRDGATAVGTRLAPAEDLGGLDTKALVKAMRDRTFSDENVAATIEALRRVGIA